MTPRVALVPFALFLIALPPIPIGGAAPDTLIVCAAHVEPTWSTLGYIPPENCVSLLGIKAFDLTGLECVLTTGGLVTCSQNYPEHREWTRSTGDVVAFQSAGAHFCVLTVIGNVECDGDAARAGPAMAPYLGGDAVKVRAGQLSCAILASGNATCWGQRPFDDGPIRVNFGGGDIVDITPGYHDWFGAPDCVLRTSGQLRCHDHATIENVAAFDRGVGVLCALLRNGNVDCRSNWDVHPWPNSPGGDYFGGDAVQVSTGDHGACLLRSNGNVACAGRVGAWRDVYFSGDAVQVEYSFIHDWCALLRSGTVQCGGFPAPRYAALTPPI